MLLKRHCKALTSILSVYLSYPCVSSSPKFPLAFPWLYFVPMLTWVRAEEAVCTLCFCFISKDVTSDHKHINELQVSAIFSSQHREFLFLVQNNHQVKTKFNMFDSQIYIHNKLQYEVYYVFIGDYIY